MPQLGATLLQKLRPQHVANWHAVLQAPACTEGRLIPASAVSMLRENHVHQAEQRLVLGLGRQCATDPLFAGADAEPWPPNEIRRHWYELTRRYNLPRVAFHALRHTHASALIAAGLDIVSISKRLGHASPTITLGVYAHKFHTNDEAAARAIDAAMNLREHGAS